MNKQRGYTLLTMPPLTQTLGPQLRLTAEKYAGKISQEMELMTALIEGLPPFDFFQQSFHSSISNWMPFYWRGFEQTTRYTYRLANLTNPDSIWMGLRKNIRTDVRKARKQLTVHHNSSVDVLIELVEKTFQRQGRSFPHSRQLMERIEDVCRKRNCGKPFFAEDENKRVHAALYLVWDEYAAYYLLGGSDPELRNSGASSLLLWEAILFSGQVSRTFDFEGSMIKPIEHFFRAFGAFQQPYMQVKKYKSLPFKIRRDLGAWLRMWRGG
jgi:lipid II:glycine glycyltransferase (peptidoglycan interpeptide bridge formation enzyme)